MKSNARLRRTLGTALTVTLLGALLIPETAVGQVGHSPDASPYRHSRARRVLGVQSGYLWGDFGDAGVGPSNGVIGGGYVDLLFDSPIAVSFSVWYGGLERFVKNPGLPPDQRTTGPFRQQMMALDGSLQLVLTGSKTWHRMAPYVGLGLGLSFDNRVPQDSTDFTFGNKFLLQPAFGFRLYLSDRLVITAEGKDVMWRLSYPAAFLTGANPIINPTTQKPAEWTHHFVLRLGLGYAIGLD